MTVTTDRADSGEIPRIDDLGTEPTEDLRHHMHRRDTTGEATENLGRYLRDAPSFEAIPRRIIDLDDTVTYMPATIGVVDQGAWERVGAADTAVHTILDSLAGARAGLDGELEGPQKPVPAPTPPPGPKLRRSVPVAAMVDREPPGWRRRAFHKGKRRKPEPRRVSPWVALAFVVGAGLAMWAGVYLAAQAVLTVVR